MRLRLLIIAILAFAVSASSAFAASVSLKVEYPGGKNYVEVGDVFYIMASVANIDKAMAAPSSVPGCQVRYFVQNGESSTITSINGKMTRSHETQYAITLAAKQVGTFNYSVNVGGVNSNTVKIVIRDKGTASSSAKTEPGSTSTNDNTSDKPQFIGQGDDNLFMRASVSKTTVYEQEALVYTLKLYSSYHSIKFIGATEAPKFEGFVIEQSDAVDKQLRLEDYQGKTYETAVVARYIIFPQSPGSKKVIGNTYTVSVDKRMYYHDAYFGTISHGVPLQLNIKPNDLTINVKPLPQPQPANFSGAVGSFNISSDLPSASLKTNQAASVKYLVSGTGNLRYINLPDLNRLYPPEIEVYSPTTTVNATVGRDDVSGSVTYEYSLMPTAVGDFTLPAVPLVYFDPETGEYKTVRSRSFEVKVAKGEASEKSQTREKRVFNPQLMPVSHLASASKPMVLSWTYWLWFIVPLVLLVASVAVSHYLETRNSDIEALRARRARRLANKWLKKAQGFADAGNREEFYDALLAALWGYLGDKLKIKSSVLTRNNVEAILSGKGVPEDIVKSVIAIIDKAEFVKYTSLDSGENMQELLRDSEKLIGDVENAYDKRSGRERQLPVNSNIDEISDADAKAIRKQISKSSNLTDNEDF